MVGEFEAAWPNSRGRTVRKWLAVLLIKFQIKLTTKIIATSSHFQPLAHFNTGKRGFGHTRRSNFLFLLHATLCQGCYWCFGILTTHSCSYRLYSCKTSCNSENGKIKLFIYLTEFTSPYWSFRTSETKIS